MLNVSSEMKQARNASSEGIRDNYKKQDDRVQLRSNTHSLPQPPPPTTTATTTANTTTTTTTIITTTASAAVTAAHNSLS
jgi:hypothetical protein